METLTETDMDLELLKKGKVRDTYKIDGRLLMVATDRLSAFDVVFKQGIPRKGEVLNRLSKFWFNNTGHIIENHFVTDMIPENLPGYVQGRSMIVQKTEPIPVECVVRGYITGSAWKDYQKNGAVCGIELPEGLKNGSELPEPIFTPATKAETGHDENIPEEKAKEIAGEERYATIKQKSLELYKFAKNYALDAGLVLADTKFEFGTIGGKAILIDEALTPDSSRYWLKDKYDEGILESLDKQFVRNYLEETGWDKAPPPPDLPDEIIKKTSERYLKAYRMIAGEEL
ncbi:phosphoribosylaminoimidazolesuccinocarboxamide synthase [Candidatus Micrarchaeota archaeon]|nr:phosphoribosylaminoimidazolesuccinocarboxamide synthase [Candidatus Micrarchaeota archaeon]